MQEAYEEIPLSQSITSSGTFTLGPVASTTRSVSGQESGPRTTMLSHTTYRKLRTASNSNNPNSIDMLAPYSWFLACRLNLLYARLSPKYHQAAPVARSVDKSRCSSTRLLDSICRLYATWLWQSGRPSRRFGGMRDHFLATKSPLFCHLRPPIKLCRS